MKYLSVFLIALAVTLGGLVVYQKFLLPKHVKKIYVIDTDRIVKMEKAKLLEYAKAQNPEKFKEVLKKDEKIRKAIKYIADRDNAVVYAKKAIIAGYDKDITNEVLIMTGGIN